jgi:uncharacterized protein (DUF488 family)
MARIYTVGHSTRSIDEFLALLREHGIACLVDVRRFPTSRHHPHFTKEALDASLAAAGIDYVHEPDMGGYRKPRPDSPNRAWRVAGFRGYADHMETPEFQAALERVIEQAGRAPTAIMCAEFTHRRCHRQLISDALVARGLEVIHVLGPRKIQPHALNPHARVLEDGRLVYPEPSADQHDLLLRDES